jgi:hypothetical protein
MLLLGSMIAALVLGLMLAVVANCIVVFTVLTMLRPAMRANKRLLYAALASVVCLVGAAAIDLFFPDPGWSFVIRYVQVMMGAAVLAMAYLLVRRFS